MRLDQPKIKTRGQNPRPLARWRSKFSLKVPARHLTSQDGFHLRQKKAEDVGIVR